MISANAQRSHFTIGLDMGVKHFDLVEELANSNKYQGTTFSVLNPTSYKITDRYISFFRFNFSSTTLESELEFSDFTMDIIALSISYDFLWRVAEWNKIRLYLGPTYNPHLNAYFQNFRGNREIEILETSPVNLGLNATLGMKVKAWELFIQSEIGIFNLWAKQIPLGNTLLDLKYQADFIGDFQEFQFNLFGIYRLSDRWQFKPEYGMAYYHYNYKDSHDSEALRQRWTVGLFYLL